MMIEAITAFLALLQAPAGDERQRLIALARALDHLSLAYYAMDKVGLDECGADKEPAPDIADYAHFRTLAGIAFPMLGFYQAACYGDLAEQPGYEVADAIDDLADIARDVTRVMWHAENSGPAEAAWEFTLGFRAHWGAHLNGLRGAVHAVLYCE